MTKHRIAPVNPGVYLKELLDELKISQYRTILAMSRKGGEIERLKER